MAAVSFRLLYTRKSSLSLALSVICRLQNALTQGQVPVVLRAVLLEVFTRHVLRRALLKLHVAEAALHGCALLMARGHR